MQNLYEIRRNKLGWFRTTYNCTYILIVRHETPTINVNSCQLTEFRTKQVLSARAVRVLENRLARLGMVRKYIFV
jgi:hypothetical protein